MNFTWDERKRKINLAKHGFDFVDAEKVFDGIAFTIADERVERGRNDTSPSECCLVRSS